MLRLNRLTDYGVVVMVHLARARDVVTAQRLAGQTCLPQPTVSKLLVRLSKGGLAAASRGAAGGYVLGRGAEDITVADIIEAVEGPVALTACVDGASHDCSLENICAVRGHWDKVNAAIRQALEGVTLEDMAHGDDPLFAPAPAAKARGEKVRGAPATQTDRL